jgi:hypothetical protein
MDTQRTCTIDGCDRPYRASGYCSRHYAKWHVHGDPLHVRRPQQPKPPVPCGADGCERDAKVRGLCGKHYKRLLVRGDTLPRCGDQGDIVERLDAQSVGVPGGCIEWTSRPNTPDGKYGRVRWGEPDPKTGRKKYQLAHRVAWALWNDVDPADLPTEGVIRHLCHNGKCINPLHLEHGTHSQNSHDAFGAGQHPARKLSRLMGKRLRAAALRRGISEALIDDIIEELS